jgi:hypothetical protein
MAVTRDVAERSRLIQQLSGTLRGITVTRSVSLDALGNRMVHL